MNFGYEPVVLCYESHAAFTVLVPKKLNHADSLV